MPMKIKLMSESTLTENTLPQSRIRVGISHIGSCYGCGKNININTSNLVCFIVAGFDRVVISDTHSNKSNMFATITKQHSVMPH